MSEVVKQLRILATSLLQRMHTDLLEDKVDDENASEDRPTISTTPKRWLAHPKTIRLSTRPRPPKNPGGSRNRSFARISKSAPMPGFVFGLKESVDALVERLLDETLLPLFRRLHPEKQGWNLSLINVAATSMADAASERGGVGRDIAKMFRRQDDVLKQWRVEDTEEKEVLINDEKGEQDNEDLSGQPMRPHVNLSRGGSEDMPTPSQEAGPLNDQWESEDEEMLDADSYRCGECGATMPLFAYGAHQRYHDSIEHG
jgi:DNA polymerase iota